MIQSLAGILTVVIVLLLYVHVWHHLKTSNDLEVYELNSLDKLDEICALRQPVFFKLNDEKIGEMLSKKNIILHKGAYLNVRQESGESLPVLAEDLANRKELSEKNQEFLKSIGLKKHFGKFDEALKPQCAYSSDYDILIGIRECKTITKHELFNRTYLYVVEGGVTCRVSPPSKNCDSDYDLFEFKQTAGSDGDYIDVVLNSGEAIFLPPYWWYSIHFSFDACVMKIQYHTYMSMLSVVPHHARQFLQKQNVKLLKKA